MMVLWLKRSRLWWCAGFLALLLTACATPQRIGVDAHTEAFDRTGRFALNVQNFGGQRDAVQGGFAWHDDGRMLILDLANPLGSRSEEHTSELQSLMRNPYAVFYLKKKTTD